MVPLSRVLLTVIGIPIAGRPRTEPLHSLPVLADEVRIDRLIQNRERVSNVFDDLDHVFPKQHEDKRRDPRALMVDYGPDGLLT